MWPIASSFGDHFELQGNQSHIRWEATCLQPRLPSDRQSEPPSATCLRCFAMRVDSTCCHLGIFMYKSKAIECLCHLAVICHAAATVSLFVKELASDLWGYHGWWSQIRVGTEISFFFSVLYWAYKYLVMTTDVNTICLSMSLRCFLSWTSYYCLC